MKNLNDDEILKILLGIDKQTKEIKEELSRLKAEQRLFNQNKHNEKYKHNANNLGEINEYNLKHILKELDVFDENPIALNYMYQTGEVRQKTENMLEVVMSNKVLNDAEKENITKDYAYVQDRMKYFAEVEEAYSKTPKYVP